MLLPSYLALQNPMNSKASKTNTKVPARGFLSRVRSGIVGLAKDYWNDPLPVAKVQNKKIVKEQVVNEKVGSVKVSAEVPAKAVNKIWLADKAQVLEKIWGVEQVLPCGEDFIKMLAPQIDISKDVSILDLSAGIGGVARALVKDFNERTKLKKANLTIRVTGLEQDPFLAKRGMAHSIEADMIKEAKIETYDPLNFVPTQKYDCIVARELFYRVVGKTQFFKSISSGLKPRGQIVFTDFILDPDMRGNEVISSWLEFEKNATPMSLSEMTQEWAKLGYDVRVNEDQTVMYKKEITNRIGAFAVFLSKNPPDKETKPLVVRETLLWARRIAALSSGLKFCRFYAIKV